MFYPYFLFSCAPYEQRLCQIALQPKNPHYRLEFVEYLWELRDIKKYEILLLLLAKMISPIKLILKGALILLWLSPVGCSLSKGTASQLIQGTHELLRTTEREHGTAGAPYFLTLSRMNLDFAQEEYDRGDFGSAARFASAATLYAERAFQVSEIEMEGDRLHQIALFESEQSYPEFIKDTENQKERIRQFLREFKKSKKKGAR